MKDCKVIGIIPAAGSASRISPIPCSKEIFPIGFYEKNNKLIPKVVSSYLLDSYKIGGAENVYVIIKNGKWDIPAYFKDGKEHHLNMAYLMADLPYGVPFTINQANGFIEEELVLFGFPDILIKPNNAFLTLRNEFNSFNNCDVLLGLFQVENCSKWDMVEFDENQNVVAIDIKPQESDLQYTWAIACWNGKFSKFINQYCQKELKLIVENNGRAKDYHLGDCLIEAISQGLSIKVTTFDDGKCMDIGTPDDLQLAINNIELF